MRTTLTAALTAVLTAGCGGGGHPHLTKAEYNQKLRAVTQSIERTVRAFDAISASQGLQSECLRLRSAARGLDTVSRELAATSPPADAANDNAAIAAGIRFLADRTHYVVGQLCSGGSTPARIAAVRKLLRSVQKSRVVAAMTAASDDLRAKGYSFSSARS